MRLYESIETLPFSCYKRLTIHGDLQALVIEGEAPEDVLLALRDRLVEAYNTAISEDYMDKLKTLDTIEKEAITLNTLKLVLIDFCKDANTGHIEIFKAAGITRQPGKDLNEYKQYVYNIIVSREYSMKLQAKKFEKSLVADVTVNDEYYDNILSAISDMKKREISDEITTRRFITYYRELVKYLDRMKHKNNGSGSTR